MKTMAFNIQHCLNYLEQKIDYEIMAKAIGAENPDIVGLNEVRGGGAYPDFANAEKLSELTGMPYFYFAQAIPIPGGGYGNAFLSKIPILEAETVPIPDPEVRGYNGYYETRCILKAKLEGGITVLVTHMGLNPDEQINAVKTVLANISDEKCILMGDFNMTPDNSLLSPIYEEMTDTAAKFSEEKLSYPSDNPERKIDYIFVSKDISVLSADIPAIIASDHRPHTANICIDKYPIVW